MLARNEIHICGRSGVPAARVAVKSWFSRILNEEVYRPLGTKWFKMSLT